VNAGPTLSAEPPASDLVARTRRLDVDPDLLAVAGRDGALFEKGRVGLAGRGCAARLPWPGADAGAAGRAAAAALAAIASDDEVGAPGCGPVAFGALPFAPGAASELVVPAVVVGRAGDGTRWITTIGRPDDPVHDRPAPPPPDPPAAAPRRLTVETAMDPDDWCALVERATKMLAGGGMDKVVLARELTVTGDRPIDRLRVLDRLRRGYPDCHLVSVDGLVAASPELLVSRAGDVVRSHPMAGTTPRSGDPATDQRLAASLLASSKDRQEHQITIDMVHDTLLGWCSYLDYEAEPSVVAVANVQHLATLVEGRLSRPAPSVLELVAALHPTPAVAGSPRDDAVRWITEHEQLDRRRYAGTAGWTDARGNGAWAVTVRSAEIAGPVARVCAGVGVVPDSDPDAELAETSAKLEALLTALVRP
jgi:menaquinone-specific isochorismate synthase